MKVAHEYNQGLIKLPIYNTAVTSEGAGFKWGTDADVSSTSCMNLVNDTSQDIFAVAAQSVTIANAASNVGTPTIYQAQFQLVDNPKIWKIYYEAATDTDLSVVTLTSTTLTGLTCDDNMEASWVYMNAGTGIGQLRYVKDVTTSVLTISSAFTTNPDSDTDFLLIRNVGLPTDGHKLNAEMDMLVSSLAEATSTGIVVLKNFCEGASTGKKELDPTLNSELASTDGLNSRGVRFFSHIIFGDTTVHAFGI